MLRVWLLAIALVALSVVALLAVPRTWMIYGYGLPKAPVVFIGTSLLANGMPPTGAGILGDGRAFSRVAVGGMKEDMEVEFADLVISGDRAQVIILEIYPFMRDFAGDSDELAKRSILARSFAEVQLVGSQLKTRIAMALSYLTGIQTSSVVIGEVPDIRSIEVMDKELHERFPMLLRKPLHPGRIGEIVRRAHDKGVEVYLIAPPQRQAVADFIGADEVARFERQVQIVAADLGLPLLYDGGIWPDSLFVDAAHLNRAGRARFMSEIARAWKAAHDG